MIRIVIADDHTIFREGLKQILAEESDFTLVGEATNGDDLMARLAATACDIVLLDLSMPGLSGEDTLHELSKINPDVHVILSSGYGQNDVLDRVGHKENVDFLQKPYNLDQLLREVFKHLGNDAASEN